MQTFLYRGVGGFAAALVVSLVACGGTTDGSKTSVGGATGLAAGGALANGGASSTGSLPSVGGAGGSGNSSSVPNLTGGKALATPDVLAAITNLGCVTSSEIEIPPALLEFVIDVSGSMNDIVAGSTQSKWEITRAALANAIGTDMPDNTGVGILFYPNMDTVPNHNTTPIDITNCVNTSAMIPAAPLGAAGSTQRAAIAQGVATAYVAGGTPT